MSIMSVLLWECTTCSKSAYVWEKRAVSAKEALRSGSVTSPSGNHGALSRPSSGKTYPLGLDLVNVTWNYL